MHHPWQDGSGEGGGRQRVRWVKIDGCCLGIWERPFNIAMTIHPSSNIAPARKPWNSYSKHPFSGAILVLGRVYNILFEIFSLNSYLKTGLMPNALGEIEKGIAELGICGAYYCKTIRPKSTNKPWLFHCFCCWLWRTPKLQKEQGTCNMTFYCCCFCCCFCFVVSVAVVVVLLSLLLWLWLWHLRRIDLVMR